MSEKKQPGPSPLKVLAGLMAGVVVVLAAGLVVLRPQPEPLPVLADLEAFSFVDQDGKPFDLERARGHVWVANFMFTSCPTVCPALTQKMAGLQKKLADQPDVRLVSITVDPEFDTPEVLKAYGARYGQDPSRWWMVTGAFEQVEKTVVSGFKMAMDRQDLPSEEGDPSAYDIVHGEHFVLVDARGRIRGYYRPEPDRLDELVRDVARLRKAGGV